MSSENVMFRYLKNKCHHFLNEMSVGSLTREVHIFKDVKGYDGRSNDMLYVSNGQEEHLKSRVIFFGGDVQDYEENMLSHRDNYRHSKWSLEKTSSLLTMAFQNSQILVVRPSRMYLNTFSCYDNFVDSNNTGAPNHSSDQHALNHLQELLTSVASLIKSQKDTESAAIEMKDVPNILIGFSKGCVVLNQIVHELEKAMEISHLNHFVKSIRTMYWLDGGHAGGSQVWLTDSRLLETLAKSEIEIRVHLTPYQIADTQRPWIKREEKIFSSKLQKFGAKLDRVMHFKDDTPSLYNHFLLLEKFTIS